MDRDQTQFGSLGFIGIYRETFRIIFKWRRIFSQITLALIVPLCVLSLAHSKLTELFLGTILTNTDFGAYRRTDDTSEIQVLYRGHGWISFYVFKVIYFTILLLLSLFSTSAVVYTIACIYTTKDHTFRKVMSVVPKAWTRLLVTFFWSFAIYLIFSTICIGLLVGWAYVVRTSSIFGIILFVILVLAFIVSYLYITLICQLAYVASVLEVDYGRKAIVKGRSLLKGKFGSSVCCFLVLLVVLVVVEVVFELFVSIDAFNVGIGLRIFVGVVSLVLLVFLYLINLVYQTVIYFVCKSYHKENIDGPALAHHLEGYSQIKDVQLEAV